jgi:uncharacterized SAM-binding protein YcdF (DUF218 family)
MSLLFIAGLALIALQFTSGIGQWISENQKATQTVAWLQWLVSLIGLAPTIITTRVIVIAAFVVLYILQLHFLLWLVVAASVWYLYKTGKYVALWAEIKNAASSVISTAETDVVKDVTKTVTVPNPDLGTQDKSALTASNAQNAAASAAAASKGVDVSKL